MVWYVVRYFMYGMVWQGFGIAWYVVRFFRMVLVWYVVRYFSGVWYGMLFVWYRMFR